MRFAVLTKNVIMDAVAAQRAPWVHILDAYGIASACFLCCGMMAGGFALTSLFVDEEPTGEATARLLAHDIRSP